jgi:hypothetical protein
MQEALATRWGLRVGAKAEAPTAGGSTMGGDAEDVVVDDAALTDEPDTEDDAQPARDVEQ